MAAIETADIFWLAVVTLLGCGQMGKIAKSVGGLRMKYKISPPETNGPAEFVRGMRAQQNTLEFFAMFVPTLWIAGIFFHQIPASLAGLYYVYQRWEYFNGYIEDAKQRIGPFKNSVKALMLLLGLSVVGLLNTGLVIYLNINLLRIIGLK